MKKVSSIILSMIVSVSYYMAVHSLSRVSASGWYQPHEEDDLKKKIKEIKLVRFRAG